MTDMRNLAKDLLEDAMQIDSLIRAAYTCTGTPELVPLVYEMLEAAMGLASGLQDGLEAADFPIAVAEEQVVADMEAAQ